MASETFLSMPIFVDVVLPFALVFALIFAILQKTKILGEEKKQIDAIIAASIALLLIAFPAPRDIIVKLMPVLAVLIVILLAFMIVFAFSVGDASKTVLPKGALAAIMIITIITLIIAVLNIAGLWARFLYFIQSPTGKNIFLNIVFIAAIVTAIVTVWNMKGK